MSFPLCAGAQAPQEKVMTAGWLTARTLSRTVPPAVPGIMFLSGEHTLLGGSLAAAASRRSTVLQNSV